MQETKTMNYKLIHFPNLILFTNPYTSSNQRRGFLPAKVPPKAKVVKCISLQIQLRDEDSDNKIMKHNTEKRLHLPSTQINNIFQWSNQVASCNSPWTTNPFTTACNTSKCIQYKCTSCWCSLSWNLGYTTIRILQMFFLRNLKPFLLNLCHSSDNHKSSSTTENENKNALASNNSLG